MADPKPATEREKYLNENIDRMSGIVDEANKSLGERDSGKADPPPRERTGVGDDNTAQNNAALAAQKRIKIEVARKAGNTAMVEKLQRELAALESE